MELRSGWRTWWPVSTCIFFAPTKERSNSKNITCRWRPISLFFEALPTKIHLRPEPVLTCGIQDSHDWSCCVLRPTPSAYYHLQAPPAFMNSRHASNFIIAAFFLFFVFIIASLEVNSHSFNTLKICPLQILPEFQRDHAKNLPYKPYLYLIPIAILAPKFLLSFVNCKPWKS